MTPRQGRDILAALCALCVAHVVGVWLITGAASRLQAEHEVLLAHHAVTQHLLDPRYSHWRRLLLKRQRETARRLRAVEATCDETVRSLLQPSGGWRADVLARLERIERAATGAASGADPPP